ncbi:DUF1842 domain-containing protein [Chromobacterium sphagni]|uniref:DUF1842 domain-containing protein n=1 Tax=Chromobacterium sphagni TaxID=1903179 RepID=A0A1S1WV04_9NEIS|nr:DUF1842 domain-containing protein [Chromobacterium sphagni]OHX10819.1 hypothetical protein BI347_20140 [Chromobacterium sphagni]OHX19517.1 hypothetical protein BI344_18135 [Chromobacterium sphagni]
MSAAAGLFHTRLTIASPNLGAPVLTLDLVVDTASKKVTGAAQIFQSTNPPVRFHANVWGHFSQAKLDKASEHHIVLSLDGSPSSPNSQIAETFHLQGILEQDWEKGFASYRFFYQGAWHNVVHAVVTEDKQAPAKSAEGSHRPTHHHPIPLYAAALQQARGSTDVAQLKALASQAEEQLKQHDTIQNALTQLKGEIIRLEKQQ